MRNQKIILVVILVLFFVLMSSKLTYSKLNLKFTRDMAFISKSYKTLVINSTVPIGDNSYLINLKNDNDYDISFSCEDVNSNFNITCDKNVISANSNEDITVDLDFKDDTNENILIPNPDGDGYITKLGIRITSPYEYSKTDPHYVESENMIVTKVNLTNLVDYVASLAAKDSSNLAIDHTTNIRYIGANPNNYVSFNNELWRILGVFDGNIKIMRTKSYNHPSNIYYDGDAEGVNTKFPSAKIKTELNEMFYYTISSRFRSMIKEGNWNVGGLNTWEWQTPETAYNTEKEMRGLFNVGLISATDYVYATGGSNRTTCTESLSSVNSCSSDNWLYPYALTTGMWTLNEFTALSGYSLIVNSSGSIAANEIKYPSYAYPVVYLTENVGFTSGDGSVDKPYKIKTDSELVVSPNYKDYIINVYLNSWGNELVGFAGKEITTFDREGGALLFANDTWGIPSEYVIDQVTVYSYASKELTTYYQRDWEEDNGWHARLSTYIFKRQIAPDLNYIGNDTLEQNKGSLKFVLIVKPKG